MDSARWLACSSRDRGRSEEIGGADRLVRWVRIVRFGGAEVWLPMELQHCPLAPLRLRKRPLEEGGE